MSERKRLVESAALDRAEPNYGRAMAGRFVSPGAHVGVITPGELAEWVAQTVR